MSAERVTAILFTVAGIGIIINLIRIAIFYAYHIKSWVKAEAVVLKYKVDQDHFADSEGWHNFIIYSYCVDGKVLNGTALTKNIRFFTSKEAVQRNPHYFEGNTIEIYYNPVNPHQSVADSKFDYYNLATLFMAGIAFAVVYYSW